MHLFEVVEKPWVKGITVGSTVQIRPEVSKNDTGIVKMSFSNFQKKFRFSIGRVIKYHQTPSRKINVTNLTTSFPRTIHDH